MAEFSRRHFIRAASAITLAAPFGQTLAVTGWQASRPIRLVVPYSAGGPTDVVARLLAQQIGNKLGQPIVVDNRPGASGSIGARAAWTAPPDGHTLLIGASDTNCIYPHVYAKPSFKAEEFVAAAPVGFIPHVLMARPDFDARTAPEILNLSKKRKLTYASWGLGSTGSLAMVLFMRAVGIPMENMIHVPYPGAAPAAQAVLAGQVDLIFAPVPMVLSQGGRLKALAVMRDKRVEALANVPTFKEQGIRFDSDADIWVGMMLPPKTPQNIAAAVSAQFAAAIAAEPVQARLATLGISPQAAMSVSAYQSWYLSQYRQWGKVISEAGIKLDGNG